MQVLRPRRSAQLFLHISKHGGQNGCMFSVIKASEEHGEMRQRRKRPAYDKYAASVASFVESYYAANQNYPKVAAVVRETGGPRTTIFKILKELKSGKNAVGSEEPRLEGLDDMDSRHSTGSVTECLPNNSASSKDSAWPDSDEFEQFAPTAVTAPADDTETDVEGIDISAENFEKNGLPGLREPTFLAILDQARLASSKADANKRVAPLMEVLQQKSSGSRRVNLSACGGIENDLSWEQSLLSIMPTSMGGKQEDTSGLRDVQSNWDNVGQTPISVENNSEVMKTALNVDGGVTGVRLVPSKWKSILNTVKNSELKKALTCESKAFFGLRKIKILLPSKANNYAHAIMHFKTKESMAAVLKLETVTVEGEKLRLEAVSAATVDSADAAFTQSARLGNSSVFHEILNGIVSSPSKGKDLSGQSLSGTVDAPAHIRMEDESLSVSSIQDLKSDLCMQLHLASGAKSLQSTISIQDCPTSIPLKSIKNFFSAFGNVQVSGADSAACSKRKVLIEFEDPSDKEKALMVQQFLVDGCHFRIRADIPSDALVVQFDAQQFTGKHKIVISACKKYGAVKEVFVRKAGVLNVHFRAHEKDRATWILDSLNGDEDLQGTKPSVVFEGYKKVEPCQSNTDTEQGDLKKLGILLRQLLAHLTSMYTTKEGILNQLSAHMEAMSNTKKDV